MPISTLYSQTLNNDGGVGFNGYTFVMLYALAALTLPPSNILKMRFTIQSVTGEGCDISGFYVGHGATSGDAYDFLATPVQVLFSGSGSINLPANTSVVSDWADFAYNKTNTLAVAWRISSAADAMKRRLSTTNATSYFRAATNEAGTVNKTSGYTSDAATSYFINLIEVQTPNKSGAWFAFAGL